MAMIALPYNEYLQRYGAQRDTMAAVVVEARKNGARIPWSYWHDQPLSEEDYLAAPMLSDPICRYDCDIPVDGVAAFVFTSADRARDLPHRPVYVSGYAAGCPDPPAAASLAARRHHGGGRGDWPGAFGRMPVWGPSDVDLPQVYDGFSPFVCFWLETLGLCRRERRIVSSRTVASTATDPAPSRRCQVVVRSGTGVCTGCPRCSSAICSSPAGRGAPTTKVSTSVWPAIRHRTSAVPSSTAPADGGRKAI